MSLIDKSIRFSLASCKTEDSVASSTIATPIDASPQPRPLNPPSAIINIINDDPLPNLKVYPIVRRSSPPQESSFRIKKLWPKLKHMISKTNQHEDNVKQMLNSLQQQQKLETKKTEKRWLGRNKVGPQI
ncbi:hypothetical protein G6F37_007452 [Rhizopus arrhizus]|nr:hypothetical protein G6F38_001226 [Rhizopus arrhizus]KAG1156608.1 hypothetical protein G6F37_007452 [Rhizopus arrhizus]